MTTGTSAGVMESSINIKNAGGPFRMTETSAGVI